MHTLPTAMIQLLASFAPLFSKRVWPHVQVLLVGTILAPGKRTVSVALMVWDTQDASNVIIACSAAPRGRVGKRAAYFWGCS